MNEDKHEINYVITAYSSEQAIDIKNAILLNTTDSEKVSMKIHIDI